MLTEARNTFNFVIKSLICNIKSSMEYKKSFILQTVFMMINNGFFLIFWLVVFGINNGNISGITMDDILYLWSIPVISWGAAHFFFGGITEINRYIINGELDTYLLQPKNMFFNVAISRCDVGAFGDLLYGTILGIIVSNSIFDFILLHPHRQHMCQHTLKWKRILRDCKMHLNINDILISTIHWLKTCSWFIQTSPFYLLACRSKLNSFLSTYIRTTIRQIDRPY